MVGIIDPFKGRRMANIDAPFPDKQATPPPMTADAGQTGTPRRSTEMSEISSPNILPSWEQITLFDLDDMRRAVAAGRLQGLKEAADKPDGFRWGRGTMLRKKSGSWWEGRVVGFYSTDDTPIGYAVQLDRSHGPVQIFPEAAFEEVPTIEALAKEGT